MENAHEAVEVRTEVEVGKVRMEVEAVKVRVEVRVEVKVLEFKVLEVGFWEGILAFRIIHRRAEDLVLIAYDHRSH